ncbi:hypothetical protein Patl1_33644 [Pistacia atlantica]|uniref:Uncharacterized protein n=1 Tax=Pistacia atlantica TaxID=434234 RepID=A0ACC0ZU46_9ROSI|nr:hypothetical protein Patl1_33644 [Pistacia atlantica]
MAPMLFDDSLKREAKPSLKTSKNMITTKKEVNKGAWTAEEDRKLAEVIAAHGPKRWKTIAIKAAERIVAEKVNVQIVNEENNNTSTSTGGEDSNIGFNVDEFFDFSNEDPLNLEWMSKFLSSDEGFSVE